MVATVAFKVVAVETTGKEKEKVRMREKEEVRRERGLIGIVKINKLCCYCILN